MESSFTDLFKLLSCYDGYISKFIIYKNSKITANLLFSGSIDEFRKFKEDANGSFMSGEGLSDFNLCLIKDELSSWCIDNNTLIIVAKL
jgi:hypothetical protein